MPPSSWLIPNMRISEDIMKKSTFDQEEEHIKVFVCQGKAAQHS